MKQLGHCFLAIWCFFGQSWVMSKGIPFLKVGHFLYLQYLLCTPISSARTCLQHFLRLSLGFGHSCIWRYSGLADRAFCELANLTILINFVEWEQFPALPAFLLTESWWWLFGTIMSLTWLLPLPTVTASSKSAGFLMLCNFFWFEVFATAGTFLLYSSV